MPLKREIIYPIFLECCQYAKDKFWEQIFEDLAYGKSPTGTYISKGYISCNYKNREFSFKICRKNSEEIYNELYFLFTEKLGILSYQEKLDKSNQFVAFEKEIQDSKNEMIRKKNMYLSQFENYTISMMKKYNLNLEQTRYLFAVIIFYQSFKVITPEDLHYENDILVSIDGIEFEDGKVKVTRELENSGTISIEECEQVKKMKMSDNWERFLKNI